MGKQESFRGAVAALLQTKHRLDLLQLIEEERERNVSYFAIARLIYRLTDGIVEITAPTVAAWHKELLEKEGAAA